MTFLVAAARWLADPDVNVGGHLVHRRCRTTEQVRVQFGKDALGWNAAGLTQRADQRGRTFRPFIAGIGEHPHKETKFD